jgi:integrase
MSSEWQTEQAAYEALNRRLREIQSGAIHGDQTLGELAEKYLRYKADNGKRSLKDDTRVMNNRLLPYFGSARSIRTLNEANIAQYERQRIGEVSAYTVCNELSVMRHMLRLARKWGYLDRVPMIELPQKPPHRERYLTEEEIKRLLAACEQSRNPYLSCIVIVALNTGMRKGEILGLEWERIDLGADLGFSARATLYHTKSKKPRTVPLNRAVIAALSSLEPDEQSRIGRLFKKRNGIAWGKIRTAFESACARAGIQRFRFHDLRHTAVSHMVMRGCSLQQVKEILGHSDFRMTLRYAHLSPKHLRSAVETLDGLTPMPTAGHTAPSDLTHNLAQSESAERPTEINSRKA